MKAAASEVIAAIERAWADTPRPPEDRIGYDPKGYDDCAEIQRDLLGKHWREVPPETLFKWRLDLPLLSPEGLRYYLPAWLLAALNDPEISGWLSGFFLVRAEDGRLAETFSVFSDPERSALRAFFKYMAASNAEEWGTLADAVPATG